MPDLDDEDDYLSDKFLQELNPPGSSTSKSYTEIRKEAVKQAKLRNDQNKLKSRRQLELESREEGLSKSLFERQTEETNSGVNSSSSKAMAIMMRMGFEKGGTLGPTADSKQPDELPSESAESKPNPRHTAEPLPINEWMGKKGIGLGVKRPRSPASAAERVAKMVKMAEEATAIEKHNFRDRARQEYETRRAEGRLSPAQRTCLAFDEKAQRKFNVLWLNPKDSTNWPDGLSEALAQHGTIPIPYSERSGIQQKLRVQMQADALQSVSSDIEKPRKDNELPTDVELEEVAQFFRLQAQDRLLLVLTYMRDRYAYCFWCGAQYANEAELETECPGTSEEDHD